MPKNYILEIDEQVVDILKQGKIEGNVYYLPQTQLERELYEKVNKILMAIGAKWNKKEKGHIFEYDIADTLKKAIEQKSVVDWKKSTDFYYTPEKIVYEMLGQIAYCSNSKFNVLEPSCRKRTYTGYSERRISKC